MSSYTELSPFLVQAFANVTRVKLGIELNQLKVTLRAERGSISLSSAISYLENWHGINVPEFLHAVFVEADRLRWKLSESYSE